MVMGSLGSGVALLLFLLTEGCSGGGTSLRGTGGSGDAGTGGADAGGQVTGGAGGSSASALHLDGVDDYVTFAGGASETTFSSELWFRTTMQTGMLLEVYSSNGADRSTYLKAGKVCFYVFTPAFSELCTTAATFSDGAWHNVAGTLGPAGQQLYVDGVMLGIAATTTTSAFDSDTGLRAGYGYIGPNGPLTFFAGDIDDIRMWNVQRTAGDLAGSRGKTLDPATPGLQGYWRLDETGSAITAPDATAAANSGTLVGFSLGESPWVMPGAF